MKTGRIPSATYRLQFHAGFTFKDARAILDYLDDLGISDIYASPYFQAAPDSTHGYDVANHNRLNPAVGDVADFRALASDLKNRGMGQVLDFVPNHMGINQSLNIWWMDVLENGVNSPYAHYFDIDWHPGKKALADRVLLPILGDRYGRVLEKGEFKLACEDGAFFLRYFETRLPITPPSYPIILRAALTHLDGDSLGKLRRAGTDRKQLAELAGSDTRVKEALEKALRQVETEKNFDTLHELLEAQAYRLSYWRVAAEEINYRRFFDINTLAAIRIEIPEVFEAAHHLVFELLERGDVTGLRIDHIDGLWDPKAYLARLQERYAGLSGGRELYLIVEKILDSTREELPADWPVHGTTGYEFISQVGQLFVNAAAGKRMTKIYERFAGEHESFANLVYEKKNRTMQIAFSSEIMQLGRMLDALSEMHRDYRDFTRNSLTLAVREVIACLPVYRTYATGEGNLSAADEKMVLRAISAARRRNPNLEKSLFDFLRGVLLLRLPEHLTVEQREAHIHFVMKFQQSSGPVMAKGVEDTVFYIYNRLAALNEVGGNPGLFGIDTGEFHRLNASRLEHFPHSLLASSTHDTKRSEDVRMRLVALSEMPDRWSAALKTWSKLTKKHRSKVDGETAPSRNEEYLIYQTLLGSWPFEPEPDYTERIQQYMAKALKEAKVNSSWTEPNEAWEQAVARFVERILGDDAFLADFRPFAEDLARIGATNSLAHLVLKCTSPGVPDFYQGTEIWDLSLVDPDNRRPVDYARRRTLLGSGDSLLADWKSGRIKLHLTRALLRHRRGNAGFYQEADYEPLVPTGRLAGHIVAFSRRHGRGQLVVVAPRLIAEFGDFPVGDIWEDAALALPSGRWTNVLTGQELSMTDAPAKVADLLREFPVGVFFRNEEGRP